MPLSINLLDVELMVQSNVSMRVQGNADLQRDLVCWVVQLDEPENLIRMQPEISCYLLESKFASLTNDSSSDLKYPPKIGAVFIEFLFSGEFAKDLKNSSNSIKELRFCKDLLCAKDDTANLFEFSEGAKIELANTRLTPAAIVSIANRMPST